MWHFIVDFYIIEYFSFGDKDVINSNVDVSTVLSDCHLLVAVVLRYGCCWENWKRHEAQ